jgi:AcrR family transcriptional regulator
MAVEMTTRNRLPREGAGEQLSREQIAATALALVDREGLEALSMRRLAQEMGTGTMTLYGYVRDKDDLLDAVIDAAAAESPAWGEGDGPWRDRLTSLMRELRRGLERHPALIQLRLRRPIMTPGALRGTEAGLQVLVAAGLDPVEASRAFRTLFLYTFGFAAFVTEGGREEHRAQVRAAFAVLPPEDYPLLTSSVEELADVLGGDEQFEFGLARVLDGIEARLPAA